jgi:putative ABC transport system ATP-binding protein
MKPAIIPTTQQPASLTQTKQPIISLHRVEKIYKSTSGGFRALKGIDLDVYPGKFVAIIGKSGAGKTTLINMITGVDRQTAGEIWVNGLPVHKLSDAQLAFWRGRNLGIIYQAFYLMPTLSLLDNVMLPMDFCGLFNPRQSPGRARELLCSVGLEDHLFKLPSAISGGQQQRVAIARALANDPLLLVADEPTGRLDSATAESIFHIFLELAKNGKTILMVTHDHSVSRRVSRVLTIADGQINSDSASASKNDQHASLLH